VLSLNFVTKNFEQAVIQGLASDKVCCTHNNRQHIFKNFRACMPKNVGASYPLLRCLVPPRGTYTPVKNHWFKRLVEAKCDVGNLKQPKEICSTLPHKIFAVFTYIRNIHGSQRPVVEMRYNSYGIVQRYIVCHKI